MSHSCDNCLPGLWRLHGGLDGVASGEGAGMTISLPDRRARFERHQRSRPPSSLFQTNTLAPTARFEAWRESMSVFLDSSLGHSDDPEAFTGEIESYLLDDIMFTRAITRRQKYDRA